MDLNNIVIDHGQYQIILNQKVIPISCTINEGQHNVQIYSARIGETAIIPPYSMQFVGTNLDAKPKGGILIQPSSQLIKTVIPNALYPAKEVAFLLVRNPTGGSTQEESTFRYANRCPGSYFRRQRHRRSSVASRHKRYTVYEWFVPYSDEHRN